MSCPFCGADTYFDMESPCASIELWECGTRYDSVVGCGYMQSEECKNRRIIDTIKKGETDMTQYATVREWYERASEGTSGDMVHNILRDWEKEVEELKSQIKTLKDMSALLMRENEKLTKIITSA